MKRDPLLYLEDMLSYADEAHAFVKGMTPEAFARDTRTRYAVSYALHVIGEAARNVPPEVCVRYPQIPWQKIIGMRNRLVHDYLGTRPDVILATAQKFAPELMTVLPPIIADLEKGDDKESK